MSTAAPAPAPEVVEEDMTMKRDDETIVRHKILGLLQSNHALLEGTSFFRSEIDTADLKSLRTTQPHTIEISSADHDTDYL